MNKAVVVGLGLVAFVILTGSILVIKATTNKSRGELTQLAIEKKDYTICDQQKFNEVCSGFPCARMSLCKIDYVKVHRDSKACDSIASGSSLDKAECYFHALQDAPKNQQYSSCEKVSRNSQGQSKCYGKFAIQSKDPSICQNALDFRIVEDCIQEYMRQVPSADASICDKYTTSYRGDICYYLAAKNVGDRKICQKISTSSLQEQCLERVPN